jgi:DME family drug/metabolite transporter
MLLLLVMVNRNYFTSFYFSSFADNIKLQRTRFLVDLALFTIRKSNKFVGVCCAILCSLGLGLAVALGPMTFNGGTTPLTVALFRALFSVIFMGLLCISLGKSLRLSWPMYLNMLFLGGMFSHMAFGNIGSTKYIPISLAALLFFVYPPVVALLNAVLDKKYPGSIKTIAIIGSFAGLGVMLGVDFEEFDYRGVVIGITAGIACAINIVWVSRKVQSVHPFVIVFYQSIVAAIIIFVLMVHLDEFRLPTFENGWWGLTLIVLLQSCSIPLFYFSIQRIGPESTGLLNNLQPVASILAAVLIFNETLTFQRVAGAFMVLVGILIIQWVDYRYKK